MGKNRDDKKILRGPVGIMFGEEEQKQKETVLREEAEGRHCCFFLIYIPKFLQYYPLPLMPIMVD